MYIQRKGFHYVHRSRYWRNFKEVRLDLTNLHFQTYFHSFQIETIFDGIAKKRTKIIFILPFLELLLFQSYRREFFDQCLHQHLFLIIKRRLC